MRCVLITLALLFAGCTSSPSPEESVPTITDPRDNNTQVTSGSHAHDYWNGQDRKTLLQQSQRMSGTMACSCPDGTPVFEFRPEAGDVVPHGTGRVELRFQFEPGESTFAQASVWAKTAQDRDLRKLGPLPEDGVFVFEIGHDDADPAHQQLSLWRVGLGVSGRSPDGATMSGASAAVEAILHRTLEIPILPPHPDLWDGATELTLWQSQRSIIDIAVEQDSYETIACHGGCLYHERLPDGVVVPFDATFLAITFRGAVAPPIGVHYHPADSWDYDVAECSSGGDTTTCEIALDFSRADSPYAKQSAWEFRLVNSQPTPAKAFAGDVEVTYTAHKT